MIIEEYFCTIWYQCITCYLTFLAFKLGLQFLKLDYLKVLAHGALGYLFWQCRSRLFQIVLQRDGMGAREYSDITVDDRHPILPDMHFDPAKSHIYVMTRNKVGLYIAYICQGQIYEIFTSKSHTETMWLSPQCSATGKSKALVCPASSMRLGI